MGEPRDSMLLTESTGRSALGADQIPDMVTSDLTANTPDRIGDEVVEQRLL